MEDENKRKMTPREKNILCCFLLWLLGTGFYLFLWLSPSASGFGGVSLCTYPVFVLCVVIIGLLVEILQRQKAVQTSNNANPKD